MKLDILVIAAHPDDAELGAGGTIVKSVARGKKVGILDLTRGELGTRGTPEIRAKEAKAAAKLMGVAVRANAGLPDGFLQNTKEQQMRILPFIRQFRPDIVLSNAIRDRHPDHGKGASLASDACFLSGLRAIQSSNAQGEEQEAWRPRAIYHFVQDQYIYADFIVDISDVWNEKMKAIMTYESQFFSENKSDEPQTPISTLAFRDTLKARAQDYGRLINVALGEGFTVERPLGVNEVSNFL